MALETKPIDIKWPLPPLFLYLSRFRAKEEGWADYWSIRRQGRIGRGVRRAGKARKPEA